MAKTIVRVFSQSDERLRLELKLARARVREAALGYVLQGQEGTRMDRLRAASDLAGIPRAELEVRLKERSIGSGHGM